MSRPGPALTLVGTLPPNKGVSDTCVEQARHLSRLVSPIRFLDFRQLYPERLYPGGTRESGVPPPVLPGVEVRRALAWYDPASWVAAGLAARGLLHLHWWTWYLFAPLFTILLVARLRGLSAVANVHNVLGHESHLLDRLCTRAFLAGLDRVIVHSRANRDTLVRLFGVRASRVEVIPLGTPDFLVAPVPRAEARAALDLPAGAPVLLVFGIIRKYKRVDLVLRAFARLRERFPGLRLVIAGKPWIDWAPYRRLMDELAIAPEVRADLEFVPAERVPLYFSAADLLVLAYSHFDASSGPGRIALGYGLPMVVSDVGGLPDLVRDRAACVFPADSLDSLVERAGAILADPELRARLSREARETAADFGWPEVARRTVEAYGRVRRRAR